MRRTSIMVCPERCGAEENLRHLERSESGGVVLKSQDFAGSSLPRNPRALSEYPAPARHRLFGGEEREVARFVLGAQQHALAEDAAQLCGF